MRVIIQPGGKTAKEVNPLGSKPNLHWCLNQSHYEQCLRGWEMENQKLRTFEIEKYGEQEYAQRKSEAALYPYNELARCKATEWYIENVKPGTIHEAELLPNNKIKIL